MGSGFFSQDNPPPLEQEPAGPGPGNVVVQEPTGVDGPTASFFGRGASPQLQAFEEDAKQAAEEAAASAAAASGSASTATTKAAEAATSATNAASSATSAATSATAATTKASEASASATAAAGSATAASTSAAQAATSATNAADSATAAGTSAANAATSAATATTKATEAATSATDAATSASSAASSATTATTKASEASTSATNAAASASTATTKASEASTSATNAANSATAAATSATNSANSATAAGTSATNAANSATSASNSATAASASATSAASAQTAAESARDATLAAFDSFDDRYLGTKTSDPTLDNDGNALVAGALYFNSTVGEMRVYTGSAWTAAYVSGAGVLLINNNLSDLGNVATARTNLGLSTVAATGAYADLSGKPTNVSTFTNDAGYLTSFTEADPTVGAHIKAITATNISNWNTAYGWGNHASAGYLTGVTSSQVTTALGYTPYNASNPSGYLSSVSLTANVTGILGVANGGTGASSLTSGYLLKGNGTSAVSASVIYDDGTNVGIGTNTPGVKLDVNGVVRSNAWMFITPNTGTDNALYRASNTGGTTYMGLDNSAGGLSGAAYALSLYHSGAYPIVLSTNGSERMRITSNGNVTVGSSSSFARLASVAADGTYQLALVGTSKAVRMRSDTTNFKIEAVDQTLSTSYEPLWLGGSLIQFGTSTTERMRITAAGNVGIGTTVPALPLVVSNAGAGGLEFNHSGAIGGGTYIQSYNRSTAAYIPNTNYALSQTWYSGATRAMDLDSSGNLGIGTSSPSAKLDVVTAGAFAAEFNGTNTYVDIIDSTVTGRLQAVGNVFYIGTTAAVKNLGFKSGAGVEAMLITSAGNVGIGTSSPQARLDVNSASTHLAGVFNSTGNTYIQLQNSGVNGLYLQSTTGAAYLRNQLNTPLLFGTNNTEKMRITGAGEVLVNRSSTSGYGKLNVDGGADFTGGNVLLCRDTGNVGIGTASPSYRLHVNSGAATTVGFFQSTGTSSFIGLSNASYTTYLGSFNDGSFRIQTPGSGFSDKVTVDISGNLLVGTTSATAGYLMSVNGALTLANGYSLSWGAYNSGGPTIAGSTNFLAFYPNGASSGEKMRITSGGQLLSGTTTAVNAGGVFSTAGTNVSTTVTKNSNMTGMTLVATDNVNTMTGLWFGVGNAVHWSGIAGGRTDNASHWGTHLSFYTHANDLANLDNANERMRITGDGNVGIGTTSPVTKLHVAGAGNVTGGNIHLGDNTDGAAKWTYITGAHYNGATNPTGISMIGTYATSTDNNVVIGGQIYEAHPATLITFFTHTATTHSTGGSERMRIGSDGNVAIGTSSTGGGRLTVAGGNGIIVNGNGASGYNVAQFINNGSITMSVGVSGSTAAGWSQNLAHLGTTSNSPVAFGTNSTERARISAAGGFSVGTTADPGAGAIYATGNITAYYSDEQLKTRLGNIDNALDILSEIDAFYYEANETAQALGYEAVREVGVSAQSVQRVLPEVVAPAPIDNKYLTVRYERLVPVLIEAIKELRAEVQQLKGN